ncbi:zinc-binding dehydrogenase [Micromonospora sp. URMC 105]|uniref:zinc-binding dehydrogenase n=1 Tax=Micromonospora sp. URMC 105 TaxID=3423413 RepID=UPI003F196AC7
MIMTDFGPAEKVFVQDDIPTPAPGHGELLVRVHATSVNPLDLQIRRGDYREDTRPPLVLGHDVSGVVEEVGAGVTRFKPGDEVWYLSRFFQGPGAYAEYHVVEESIVARKPRSLSHIQAASLPLVAGTVWEAFVDRAQLRVAERVLVHGGAGGVGTVAIQLAAAMGAEVLTTCRGRDAALVRELGAHHTIDFAADDVEKAVLQATGGRGVDVVLDTVGGETLTRSPHLLAPDGRVVTIVDTAQPQNLLAAWGVNASYHFLFTRPSAERMEKLARLAERGLLRPVVGAVLPLAQVPDAHLMLEGRSATPRARGKLVISVSD